MVAAVAGGGPILLALAVAAAHPPVIGPAGIWLLRRLLEAAPKNMAIVDTVRRRLANV